MSLLWPAMYHVDGVYQSKDSSLDTTLVRSVQSLTILDITHTSIGVISVRLCPWTPTVRLYKL